MRLFAPEDLSQLLETRTAPALSFYLPAQQPGDDPRKSAMRLKNLIRRAERGLKAESVRTPDIHAMLEPVSDLVDEQIGVLLQERGLALFVTKEGMQPFALPFVREESVTLSDRFRIRPLIPLLTGDGTFHVLAVSLSDVRLYDATRDRIEARDVTGFPESLQEILDSYEGEKQLQHMRASARGAVFHGYNDFKDSEKTRIEEYLRQVDAAIGQVLPDDRSPLVPVCVDYLYPLYRSVARHGHLTEQHVSGSPESISVGDMHDQAWQIVRPLFSRELNRVLTACRDLTGTGRVLEGLRPILPAASRGQVDTLLLSPECAVFGSWDETTETVSMSEQPDSHAADLADLAAAAVLQRGGSVYTVDAGDLPAGVTIQALLRY